MTLTGNITGMTTEQIITIQEGQNIVLDMDGHSITVDANNFEGRPFVNRGTFTIQGNGTIDVSNAGANGYGTVNNFGTLTVVDGTYTNLKESDASNFYNRSGGTATFENATINGGGGCIATQVDTTTTINGGNYSSETYPTVENRGNMLITGGTFKNTSCSSCDGRWGYTVRSGESAENAYLKIQGETEDSVKVTGVQGGLAVIGGTADIYNGSYQTVPCEKHPNGASSFYAGYFTGESYKTATTIYGGSFQSCSKTAVRVGNGNPAPDSGAGKESTVMIKGGTFVGGDADHTAITVEQTNHAIGAANITGGTFSSDVKEFLDLSSNMVKDEETGNWVAAPIPENEGVAEINGKYYKTLGDAIASVGDGDTIKLLKDLESSTAITIPAGVTLDGDGKTLTYTGGSVEAPSNGAFLTAGGENVTIQNLTVETKNQIKHGVQFYSVKSGKLSGVTVNGGTYTSVIVNNSQNIILENCVLNSNGYTNIEYAVGSNISDMVIPSLTVDNVTFKPAGETGAPLMIWVDKDTVARIKTVIGGNPTDEDVVAKIKESVTNKNPGDVVISVGLSDGSVDNETVSGVGYPSGSTSYAITVDKADNGTVTASRSRANKGLTVTLTVKPDEGYQLVTLTVTDKNGNEVKLTDKGDGKYTFTMPASAVTVEASFVAGTDTGLPFTDVKADDWFYEAVKYVYDNKLMDGTSSTTFAPLMTTNRAMIVTILWRQAGSPVVNYAMNFTDVEDGVWYTEAVRWAAAEGVVKGYSDTVFAPNDTVTREQLAVILYRYAEYKEYDVSDKGDLTTFADGANTSSWATEAMEWAVGSGLLTGKDGGKLDPTGTATRAEVATILMRFVTENA